MSGYFEISYKNFTAKRKDKSYWVYLYDRETKTKVDLSLRAQEAVSSAIGVYDTRDPECCRSEALSEPEVYPVDDGWIILRGGQGTPQRIFVPEKIVPLLRHHLKSARNCPWFVRDLPRIARDVSYEHRSR